MKKRAKAEKKDNNERWLLTYSDLITLLMVFFVVMFAISKADERKFAMFSASMQRALLGGILSGDTVAQVSAAGETGGDALLETLAGIRAAMQKLAQEQGVSSGVDVRLSREGIVVDLSGSLLFDSGKADLKPKAKVFLNEIAIELRQIPNEIRVGGYTDNIPPNSPLYPTNWELSTARALAVSRYLIESCGIPPERVGAAGYGEYRPVANNDTRENRALNRRVEIVIIYPEAAANFVEQ